MADDAFQELLNRHQKLEWRAKQQSIELKELRDSNAMAMEETRDAQLAYRQGQQDVATARLAADGQFLRATLAYSALEDIQVMTKAKDARKRAEAAIELLSIGYTVPAEGEDTDGS